MLAHLHDSRSLKYNDSDVPFWTFLNSMIFGILKFYPVFHVFRNFLISTFFRFSFFLFNSKGWTTLS